jgi:hypothetical protein
MQEAEAAGQAQQAFRVSPLHEKVEREGPWWGGEGLLCAKHCSGGFQMLSSKPNTALKW